VGLLQSDFLSPAGYPESEGQSLREGTPPEEHADKGEVTAKMTMPGMKPAMPSAASTFRSRVAPAAMAGSIRAAQTRPEDRIPIVVVPGDPFPQGRLISPARIIKDIQIVPAIDIESITIRNPAKWSRQMVPRRWSSPLSGKRKTEDSTGQNPWKSPQSVRGGPAIRKHRTNNKILIILNNP
jgi:hypothetical protein